MTNLLEMPLFAGILFFVLGLIMKFFPPKKINILYGYKTNSSKKSQESWDFAQQFSAVKMIQSGVFLIVMGCVENIVNLTDSQQTLFGFLFFGLGIFFIIFTTEKAIKNKFSSHQ